MEFHQFSSREAITRMLVRLRVKIAFERNKKHLIHLHSKDPKYNYHRFRQSSSEKLICSLFPPRKKWKQPGFKNRLKDGTPRNTSEKVMISLQLTIQCYREKEPLNSFLLKLDDFINDIQQSIHINKYKINRPFIIPILKEETQSKVLPNICRPIASYGLKDKIILSITNRYLTAIFDKIFCDESFAFRSKRKIDDCERVPTHHDPVEKILKYRKEHKDEKLWVSECDMKKFFDTVNHTIIKKEFEKFFSGEVFNKYSKLDLSNAKRILYSYLDSYTFNGNVLPLNKDQGYFESFRIENGEFGWVEKELIRYGYYKRIRSAKIGIPQGGALSGLIANVVLHYIDMKVLSHQDGSLLYVRFCDDMLIIHPNEKICGNVFNEYVKGLKSKKLVPHLHAIPPFNAETKFWGEKSKKSYLWSSDYNSGSPWIGFVGYEIHYKGYLRVRKSSLLKEMKKQFKVVGELKKILSNPSCRSPNRSIYESAANRLIGMSVGRVNLWNYSSFKNEMCWTSGFKLLNDNKHSRIQLRRLDSCRSKLLRSFKSKIDKMAQKDLTSKRINPYNRSQPFYYGKPFSYYYQFISKKEL